MHVAGIDAHATYVVVAIVSNGGALVQKPVRIRNRESGKLRSILQPFEQREQATLVRHRARLARLRTQAASRIHAELHAVGLSLPRGRLLTRDGRRWVHTTAWPLFGPEQQHLVRTHERIADALKKLIKGLDRCIRGVGTEIPSVALLETVPGIGPYRALLIATETLPIERFQSPKHLVSYAGLAPRSSRSGMSVHYGPIPAGANRWLRNAFVQTAMVHVRRAPVSSGFRMSLRRPS